MKLKIEYNDTVFHVNFNHDNSLVKHILIGNKRHDPITLPFNDIKILKR